MLRIATLAAIFMAVAGSSSPRQPVGVLHIKVVLLDAERKPMPVPRHSLLVSDNPASAAPRLIVTAADGTADVRLRPGNYTVESDSPVAFNGKSYEWRQTIDIVAGSEKTLELTTENAAVEAVSEATATGAAPLEADPAFLLPQWQGSVVALWTPLTRASGVIVDTRGLVATSARAIGDATPVEVQISPTVKLAAAVLAADAARDIAILWVDGGAIGALKPLPLGCGQARDATPPVSAGQEIFMIGAPLRQRKNLTSGRVSRVAANGITSDFVLASGSAGGPVFAAGGSVIGITSPATASDRAETRVVSAATACEVLIAAEAKMANATAPSGARLPVEPQQPFPVDALRAGTKRSGTLKPYQVSSSNFDVTFITPGLTYGALYQSNAPLPRTTSKDTRKPEPEPEQSLVRPLLDFSNWADYVHDFPPVLLVRVTPRLVEGFWTRVGRIAAGTQGVSLPPIKRVQSGFLRLRALCGEAEVAPIHPFRLEQRLSESEAIYEGLYAYDPGALGPHCGTVTLLLYSAKEPAKSDTRVVDAQVIQQVWDDFAPYRATK